MCSAQQSRGSSRFSGRDRLTQSTHSPRAAASSAVDCGPPGLACKAASRQPCSSQHGRTGMRAARPPGEAVHGARGRLSVPSALGWEEEHTGWSCLSLAVGSPGSTQRYLSLLLSLGVPALANWWLLHLTVRLFTQQKESERLRHPSCSARTERCVGLSNWDQRKQAGMVHGLRGRARRDWLTSRELGLLWAEPPSSHAASSSGCHLPRAVWALLAQWGARPRHRPAVCSETKRMLTKDRAAVLFRISPKELGSQRPCRSVPAGICASMQNCGCSR